MSVNLFSSLGAKRLISVHSRVDYLCEQNNYSEKNKTLYDLCERCAVEQNLSWLNTVEKRREVFLKCSRTAWVCDARKNAVKGEDFSLHWNPNTLITQKKYSEILQEAVDYLPAPTAMYTIYDMNQDMINQQPHMLKMCHIGEELVYMNYNALNICNDIFPLPPPGNEYINNYVEPMDLDLKLFTGGKFMEPKMKEDYPAEAYTYCWTPNCKCVDPKLKLKTQSCRKCDTEYKKTTTLNKEEEKEEKKIDKDLEEVIKNLDLQSSQIPVEASFEDKAIEGTDERMTMLVTEKHKKLTKMRDVGLLSCKDEALLDTLEMISCIPDPCGWCTHMKKLYPMAIISCTGHEELCVFKHKFFNEWPSGLDKEVLMQKAVLNCDDRYKYRELMNKVFSMKYIERCLQVKFIIDNDLIMLHPHLAPLVAFYDVLLLRYIWPYTFENSLYDSELLDRDSVEEDGEIVFEFGDDDDDYTSSSMSI